MCVLRALPKLFQTSLNFPAITTSNFIARYVRPPKIFFNKPHFSTAHFTLYYEKLSNFLYYFFHSHLFNTLIWLTCAFICDIVD